MTITKSTTIEKSFATETIKGTISFKNGDIKELRVGTIHNGEFTGSVMIYSARIIADFLRIVKELETCLKDNYKDR